MRNFLIFLGILILLTGTAGATNYCNDASIVGCYIIEDGSGTTVTDQSSNHYNGTFLDATHPTWSTTVPTSPFVGTSTASLLFNGSSGYVQASTNNNFFLPGQNSSAVAWIYPTGLGENSLGRILTRYFSSTENNDFYIQGTNTLEFIANGGTNLISISSNNAITLNAWNHVAVTWDGSTTATNVHLYVNGNEVTYQTQTNGNNLATNLGNFFIGNRSTFDDRTFAGNIDEVGTFTRILSQTEIQDIMNNGLTGSPVVYKRKSFSRAIINKAVF